MANLYGITLVRNGDVLGYPYIQTIRCLKSICDKVLVNVDYTSMDNTLRKVESEGVSVIKRQWDMECTGDGGMLATEANALLSKVPNNSWVVYLQADEVIHQDFKRELREIIESLERYQEDVDPYTTIELYRAYFWKDLQTVRLDWSLPLARVFKKGFAIVSEDGMPTERLKGRAFRPFDHPYIYQEKPWPPPWIYHYSRVGRADLISARLLTLDQLFHEREDLPAFPTPYDFKTREFDTFSKTERPGIKEESFFSYNGPHPEGIEEFYGTRS